MKRIILLIAALFTFAAGAHSQTVNEETARLVATNFWNSYRSTDVKPATVLSTLSFSEIEHMHIFDINGEGFVIVSGDLRVQPILAYSFNSTFPEELNPELGYWLRGYEAQLSRWNTETPGVDAESNKQWQPLLTAAAPDEPVSTTLAVPALMTTRWNQSPYYNKFCPYDSVHGGHAVVGCVATAMAQIMRYWQYPAYGQGSHTYHYRYYGDISADFGNTSYLWHIMPNICNEYSLEAEVDATATISFHCGVAVEMMYGTSAEGGSGAYSECGPWTSHCAVSAFVDYFKYDSSIQFAHRYGISDEAWTAILDNEVENGRPVYYHGSDSTGGHAFVLDGADTAGHYHFNWGWGGFGDGFYSINDLGPRDGGGLIGGNATYTFNLNNSALIGIQPSVATGDTVAVVDMRFDSTMGTVSGNGTYTPFVDEVHIWAHAAEGYRFGRWAGGSKENPIYFLANGNLSDSAIFAPVHGDTVGYCDDSYRSSWHDDYGDVTQWGIRLPGAVRNKARSLSAVQYIPYQQGTYTLEIYVADDINNATPIYTADLEPLDIELRQWTTYTLDSAIWLADTATVWITMSYTGGGYPATMGRYVGNSDGIWYHLPDGWVTYDQADGVFYTWMLRGIFEERLVRVSVETNLSTADYEDAGITIVGAGDYVYGDTACLFVNPGISYSWGWGTAETVLSDAETPKCFPATADTTLYVWFYYCTGIDDADAAPVRVSVIDRTVSLGLPEGTRVETYDIWGRLVATRRLFTLPAAGVYMIKVEGYKPVKITVL